MSTLDDLLASYPPEVQATVRRARKLILSVFPDAAEAVRPGWKNVTFGRSRAMSDTLFAICPQRTRVNLNLFGADLPDPAGLLEGTGVRIRHVKLASPVAVDAPALRALLEAAADPSPDPSAKRDATDGTAARVAPPNGYKLDVSRTFDATLHDLYAAWAEPDVRGRWLAVPGGAAAVVVRKATPMKSMRATWPDGSWLAVTFHAGSERRTRVNVEHSRLPDPAAVERWKLFWDEQLTNLAVAFAARPAVQAAAPESGDVASNVAGTGASLSP